MLDEDESVEPSLDQLSQAFAAAMGRGQQDAQPESELDSESESRSGGDQGATDCSDSDSAALATDEVDVATVDPDDACPISPKSVFEAILFVGHPENEPIAGSKIAKLLRGVDVDELPDLVTELNDDYVRHEMPYRILAEPLVNDSGAIAKDLDPADEVSQPSENDLQAIDEGSSDSVAEEAESNSVVDEGAARVASMKASAPTTGYRLTLRDEFVHLRESFYGRVREAQLSQLAVDVLAVVAYNQPITREDINRTLDTGLDTGRVLNQLVRRNLLQRQTSNDKAKTRRKEYVTTTRFLQLFHLQDIGDLPRTDDP